MRRETQEEGLGKQVVIAPKEAENANRGKGGFCQRHNYLEENLISVAAFHVGRFFQLHRQSLNVAGKHHDGKGQVSCYLRQRAG